MNNQNEVTAKLFASFEACCFQHEGQDAWRAREIMRGLGYATWENFREAIRRAWQSCRSAEIDPAGHFLTGDGLQSWNPEGVFRDATKNPQGGRPSEDVILTRLAAYLVAMNGDVRKPEVAFAQHYFATATRQMEVLQQRMQEASRLQARRDLADTEMMFQGVLFQYGLDGPGVAIIRSKGDQVLFGGNSTDDMKRKWKVGKGRPLSDFAPEVVVKAKDLGAAMTAHNVKAKKLHGQAAITVEHKENNATLRHSLGTRGIVPEKLQPEEDIKKVERRHNATLRELSKPKKTISARRPKGKTKDQPNKPAAD